MKKPTVVKAEKKSRNLPLEPSCAFLRVRSFRTTIQKAAKQPTAGRPGTISTISNPSMAEWQERGIHISTGRFPRCLLSRDKGGNWGLLGSWYSCCCCQVLLFLLCLCSPLFQTSAVQGARPSSLGYALSRKVGPNEPWGHFQAGILWFYEPFSSWFLPLLLPYFFLFSWSLILSPFLLSWGVCISFCYKLPTLSLSVLRPHLQWPVGNKEKQLHSNLYSAAEAQAHNTHLACRTF